MNWSKCRQSAGVDARSERLQVVHCVRGEHSTSCFSDSLRLQSASMTGVKQARATRCATGPALRDGMSVHEASRCQQEQSWCRAARRSEHLSGLAGSAARERRKGISVLISRLQHYLSILATTDGSHLHSHTATGFQPGPAELVEVVSKLERLGHKLKSYLC